jgi:hypothetical protein
MGMKSRRKGYNGELEVKHICESAGVPVKRSFMSGLFEADGHDLEINCRPVSVKRRANGMDWAYQELEKCDYVLFRADNKPWLKVQKWEP